MANFNFKRAAISKQKYNKVVKSADEIRAEIMKAREKKEQEKKDSKRFIVYVSKNYDTSLKENKKEVKISVWDKLEQRYVTTLFTNDIEKSLKYVYKYHRKSQSYLLDIRGATHKELVEKYRMRF